MIAFYRERKRPFYPTFDTPESTSAMDPSIRALFDEYGPFSNANVPLMQGGSVLGSSLGKWGFLILNAIIGYAELLAEECEDLGTEEFLPDLGKIQSAGQHLLTLISGILDLAKVEAGRMDLFVETVDIASMLRRRHDHAGCHAPHRPGRAWHGRVRRH